MIWSWTTDDSWSCVELVNEVYRYQIYGRWHNQQGRLVAGPLLCEGNRPTLAEAKQAVFQSLYGR